MRPPNVTWSLDSVPIELPRKSREKGTDGVRDVLDAVSNVPMPVSSKDELIKTLEAEGVARGVAMWMTTNLKRAEVGEGFVWKFDIATAEALFESFGETSYGPFLTGLQAADADGGDNAKVHLLKAERNPVWDDVDVDAFVSGLGGGGGGSNVQVHTLPDSGHWVHVDNLEGLTSMVAETLKAAIK